MSTCPECGQLLPPDATSCKNCGHDLRPRHLPPERRSERDEEQDADELLAAVIATDSAPHPPPAWAGADETRPPAPAPKVERTEPELRDVVPAPEKTPFWRRRR